MTRDKYSFKISLKGGDLSNLICCLLNIGMEKFSCRINYRQKLGYNCRRDRLSALGSQAMCSDCFSASEEL